LSRNFSPELCWSRLRRPLRPALCRRGLTSVGEISGALTPILGENAGRIVFRAGVLGAALVAAIVSCDALEGRQSEIPGMRLRSAGAG
jgi:hypothetical protein